MFVVAAEERTEEEVMEQNRNHNQHPHIKNKYGMRIISGHLRFLLPSLSPVMNDCVGHSPVVSIQ